ncbi:hypothetical protein PR202_ga30167 [Eleusine coracana subsp. coracana]|uniref:DUF7804 domain-containing protein n=1 Tax=Eleusine coracana subsp. coracana TaxID=191504 RepID=A0AAV5DNL2_ELECO|nr:hypothetical protein PR202_ga30167 [Eleusine coracana subsp. coracana]
MPSEAEMQIDYPIKGIHTPRVSEDSKIMRSTGEASFLVHLFSGDDEVTVRREPTASESWPDVRRRWGSGGEQRQPKRKAVRRCGVGGAPAASSTS